MDTAYAKRREAVRRKMRERGLDAVLIRYAANRYYLSGFELHDVQYNESSGSLVIGADGRDYLATDARYTDAAEKVFARENIVIYRSNIPECLAKLLHRCGSRIGIEQKVVSQSFYRSLVSADSRLTFTACDGLVEELRLIKDPCELKALEASFALNHAMLAWLEPELLPGRTEEEIAWLIEKYFREHGASELAFASIVAVNENAAMPHAIPSKRPIEDGSIVLVDVGCRVDGYVSDQTRTFWVGKHPSARFLETLSLVREAQQKAMEMMRPGVRGEDVYRTSAHVFEEAHVAEHFTHGLGHGVGLETHEDPSLSPYREVLMQEGMVVTVEPGLYFPDWGGVRWENTVVVEKDGVRIF